MRLSELLGVGVIVVLWGLVVNAEEWHLRWDQDYFEPRRLVSHLRVRGVGNPEGAVFNPTEDPIAIYMALLPSDPSSLGGSTSANPGLVTVKNGPVTISVDWTRFHTSTPGDYLEMGPETFDAGATGTLRFVNAVNLGMVRFARLLDTNLHDCGPRRNARCRFAALTLYTFGQPGPGIYSPVSPCKTASPDPSCSIPLLATFGPLSGWVGQREDRSKLVLAYHRILPFERQLSGWEFGIPEGPIPRHPRGWNGQVELRALPNGIESRIGDPQFSTTFEVGYEKY